MAPSNFVHGRESTRAAAVCLGCLAAVGGWLAAGGCVAAGRGTAAAEASARVAAFFRRPQDPRRYWLHAYETPAGPVWVGGNRLHPNQIARLQFVAPPTRGAPPAPVVEARGREPPVFPALVDTSARECWAEFDAAVELGMIPLGPAQDRRLPAHVREETPGHLCVLSTLRLGELRVETALFHVPARAGPLGNIGRGVERPPPRLVLGCELLTALHYVRLDYRAGTVTLSSTSPYRVSSKRFVAEAPLELVAGAWGARGLLDGVPVTFLFDSAGDFEVAVAEPDARTARQVTLGDLVVRDVALADARALGLGLPQCPRIGRRLLSRFVVTFDPKMQKVFFERPGGV